MKIKMEKYDVFIFVAISLLVCPKAVICQNCGYRRFVLAAESDYFPSENTTQVIPAPDVSVCARSCYRNRRCIAVGFDQSSHQCHMFSRYRTRTTGGTRLSGVRYLTLESRCGHTESSLPRDRWRDDVIIASQITCDDTKIFEGMNDTSFCIHPSSTWTSAGGGCVDDEIPFRINGEILRPINAKLTIVGTPMGEIFEIYVQTENNDYLLKINVDVETNIITRNSKVNGAWQQGEDDLDQPFPFVVDKTFMMDIVSSEAEFTCSVDGQLLFTFAHRLPRESVHNIAILGSVKLLKILKTQ